MQLKIATWNVNSIRTRLDHAMDWLALASPDILALQETKVVDALFPREAFEAKGYNVYCAGQKSYNGVALLSKYPLTDVLALDFCSEEKRCLTAMLPEANMRIVTVYVPNGSAVGSEKYGYKLNWLSALQAYLVETLSSVDRCIVLGDFNIAPADSDVYDPDGWREHLLCSTAEREALQALLSSGFTDTFRMMHPVISGKYSWWDYRMQAFRRKLGLRIDLILHSAALTARVKTCHIDERPRGWERPSDHAPVMVTVER